MRWWFECPGPEGGLFGGFEEERKERNFEEKGSGKISNKLINANFKRA